MNHWLFLIPAAVFIVFWYERWVRNLNLNQLTTYLPLGAEGIYDANRYAQAQSYSTENGKLAKWSSIVTLISTLLMVWFGAYTLDSWIKERVSNDTLVILIFFTALSIGSTLISIPFDLWHTFVIEKKFGFNTTTIFTFVKDLFANTLVSLITSLLMIWIIWLAFCFTGRWFWIAATIGMVAFSVFMSTFYTTLVVPLFNKLTPIPDGDLKNAIQKYCNEVKFPVSNVYIMDGSKRSTKANAYFSGLGKKKDIVLFDTLISNYTVQQVISVLAHEVGHYKKNHIFWGLVLEAAYYTGLFYLLSYVLNDIEPSKALGVRDGFNFHLNLFAFAIVIKPLSILYGIISNFVSRMAEYQADAYSATTNFAEPMIETLKKLSSDSLSNLTPHWLYVMTYYSHPPVLKRLRALEKYKLTK